MEELRRSGIHYRAHPSRRGWRGPRPPSDGRNRHPGWLILDRFVHRSSRDPDDDDVTASETCFTCTGRPIRASLRVADYPAVSRLYLHWPGRKEFPTMPEPYVIAAHGHSILFKAKIPFKDDMMRGYSSHFPIDMFVYSSFSSPPSLHRLPACLTGGVSAPEDKYFRPYRITQQRPMLESFMGILCHGDNGDFTVADLTKFTVPEAELCLLHHRASAASASATETETAEATETETAEWKAEWKVRKVRLPQPLPFDDTWTTDAVIPIDGRFLCWVDYYQGILLADILLANDDNNQDHLQFHFIPLPEEALASHRQYPEGDCHDPSRCVCVDLQGNLKLVVVAGRPRSHFRVTSWTMCGLYRGEWIKDGAMGFTEFWGLYQDKVLLPRVRPSYPLVNFCDPYAIFFLLEDEHADVFWMIEVDIREKVLNSCALYINEEEEEEKGEVKEEEKEKEMEQGCPPIRIAPRNVFDGHSFILSHFSTYLSKDAIIRSRERSKKLQKVKELRVMQKKSQLEARQPKERVKALKAVKCRA